MSGFTYEADGRWVGGRIYGPNSGRTHKGAIRQIDANTLKLRGYVGISLFGRTDTWTRDQYKTSRRRKLMFALRRQGLQSPWKPKSA